MRRALLAVAVTLAVASVARAETVVLTGATVLPQDGKPIEDARVVLDGGKIAAVGPRSSVAVPEGAREIPVKGFLVPGLIDVHAHVADPDIFSELFVANGVTTVRDLGNQLDHVTALQESIRTGKRLGPDLVFVGPILDGSPPTWPSISEVVTDPAAVPGLLQRLKGRGVQAFKVYESLEPEVYDAILVEAKKLGMPVVGHVPRKVGVLRCIDAGQDVLEHLDHFPWVLGPRAPEGITGEITGWASILDPEERELIAKLVAKKTKLDPTRLVLQQYSRLTRGLAIDVPESRYVPKVIREGFWKILAGTPRASEELDRLHEAGLARALLFVKRAHDAGVPILAGSDTPNPYVVPGVSLAQEVALLAKALGPEEALRSATLVNARALGLADRGHVTKGARADLLLVDEDPRKDATALRKIGGVVVNGRVLLRADLDRLLEGTLARTKKLDERPVRGFESIDGELLAGRKPSRPEVRLEGKLGTFPTSYWMRMADYRDEGGSIRVLRSTSSMPIPLRTEERLELDARGNVVRFHVAHDLAGQWTEAVASRGETTWRVSLKRLGAPDQEVVVPLDEHLTTTGELLLAHLCQSLSSLEEGQSRDVPIRFIDLDRLAIGDRADWTVTRVKNPITDPKDPRSSGRAFSAKGPTAELGKMTVWIDDAGDVLGLQLDLAIGRFTTRRVPGSDARATPKKKYY